MSGSVLKRGLLIVLLLVSGNMFLSAQNNLKLKYKRSIVYAGIEVGSKGVKMSLIEMSRNKNSNYNIVEDTSVNTDFISFTPETFEATLNALSGLYYNAMEFYQINPDKIFTVVSSGVKVIAEKGNKTPWINKLIDSFKVRTRDPNRQVEVIGAEEEARLSHLGIVPASKRYTTFLIDIGSGNTKGGYFPGNNTNHIRLFELTWGTQSTTNAAIQRLDNNKSLDNYNKQLERVLAGDADKEITYAVNVSGAYNMTDNIAFSGGAAWATATLLFPDLIDNPVVPVTYQQVEKFNQDLYTDYNLFSPDVLLRKINDNNADKQAIAKSVKTVNKVFNQRAMLAASGLLLKIMRQFEGVYEKKQFYLVKNGQVGWVSAYVNQSVDK